jgi:hypothetical protein
MMNARTPFSPTSTLAPYIFRPSQSFVSIRYICLLYIIILFTSCAKPITPEGGPKDQIPPRIIKTWPENGTLNFSGRQIIFLFSEYVESANLSKDVFITPIPTTPPEMIFKGKKLFINWKDEWKEQTTYVIQPGKGIRDVNEKNPLDSLFQFAFSTGSWLDSLEVSGKVLDPMTGSGAAGVSMLLFNSDSIVGDSIFKKRPAYAAISQDDGFFQLKYLAPGNYLLYGVKEENPNYEYNSLKEALALTVNPTISLPDSLSDSIQLYLSIPDLDKPKLRSKTWLTQYLLETEWSEPIRDIQESGSAFSIQITDTLGENPAETIWAERLASNPEKIRVYLKQAVSEPMRIQIKQVCDTLLTCIDTSFVIQPRKQEAKFPLRLQQLSTPLFSDTLYLLATEPLDDSLPDTAFTATDTAGVKISLPRITEGRIIKLITTSLAAQKISWTIRTDSMSLQGYSGARADTVYQFAYTYPDKSNFGLISGSISDSLELPIQKPMMKILHKESGKVWYQQGREFKFDAIQPGELQILWFDDQDNNGRWTPGRLHPYQLPERIFPIRNIPKIREGWELENVKMEMVR